MSQDNFPDIDRLRAVARIHWRIPAAILLLGIIISVVVAFLTKPQFLSTAVLMRRETLSAGALDAGDGDDSRSFSLQFEAMALAHPLLEATIREMDLYPDIVAKDGVFEAVVEMKTKLKLQSRGGTALVLTYTAESPEVASAVVGRLASKLITNDGEVQQAKARAAEQFLQRETTTAETALRRAEEDYAAFLMMNPGYRTATDTGGAGFKLRTSTLSGKSRAHAATASSSGTAMRIEDAVKRSETAYKKVIELRGVLGEEHPDFRNAQEQLEFANSELRQMRVPSLALTQSSMSSKVVNTDDDDAPQAKDSAAVGLETRWRELKRQWEDSAERYNRLRGRLLTSRLVVAALQGTGAQRLEVLEPAAGSQRPVGKSKRTVFSMGAALTIMLAGAVLAQRMYQEDRLFTPRDAHITPNIGLLAVLPALPVEGKK